MIYIIIGIVVVILLYVVAVYNSLVGLRNKVGDQSSQIEVELKRRFDLVPNLVETVKGYAKHESETLENVIAARNEYANAGSVQEGLEADKSLTGAISKLFALAENYPDLKANQGFLDLQNELSEIEQQIVYKREFYNETVRKYIDKIQMFPSSIVAKMFNFKEAEYFKATESEKENVKVKF